MLIVVRQAAAFNRDRIFIKELMQWLPEKFKINMAGQLFQWILLFAKFLLPTLLIK
jgi:hypothetical protein